MPANQSATAGVRYTQIYQDATSTPLATGATAYNLSNPLPAGQIEAFGLNLKGTGVMSASTITELFSGVRLTFNGDQWCNLQVQAGDTASTNQSRFGAMLQDTGGLIQEELSLTDFDCTVWIPCGINVPNNSRFELALNFLQSLVKPTNYQFTIWCKYGKSTNMTLYTNQTSQNIAANAQTMVSVKIPSIPGATVAGIQIQGATAADNLTSIIPKVLGDFSLSPSYLRAIAGAGNNGYEYAFAAKSDTLTVAGDAAAVVAALNAGAAITMAAGSGGGLTGNAYSKAVPGYYFCPLYNATTVDGSLVLLITASQAEFYTFTPVLNLPTSGAGQRQARQTTGAATGSKGAILSRAEDI